MTSHPNRSKVRDWPGHLRAFRASHDLTQRELADKLMVSQRLVENWEGGVNVPPPYLKIALQELERKLAT